MLVTLVPPAHGGGSDRKKNDMETTTPTINRVLFAICGVAFSIPCLFFGYYSLRLLYVNLTMPDPMAHWSFGMLIGAIAFPLATLVFGLISYWFFKQSRSHGSEPPA